MLDQSDGLPAVGGRRGMLHDLDAMCVYSPMADGWKL